MCAIIVLLAVSAVDLHYFESVNIISGNASQVRRLMRLMDLTTNKSNVVIVPSVDWRESPCLKQRRRDGCALAHLKLLRKIAALPYGWHLVFEDDAVPSEFVKLNSEWAENVMEHTQGLAINLGPSDVWPSWGQLAKHPLTMISQVVEYYASTQWVVLPGWSALSHAYIVHTVVARKIAEYVSARMCDNHWDIILAHHARWDPHMQFLQHVYMKNAGWSKRAWRNYGLFGQMKNHKSQTSDI